MTSQRLDRLLATAAFALLCGWAPAIAQSGGTVVASGGGYAAAANVRLNGTVGQPIVGRTAQGKAGASQGFWRSPSPAQAHGAPEAPTTGETTVAFTGAPNPFSGFSDLTIRDLLPGRVTIDLYDAAGAHVGKLMDEMHAGGNASIRLEGADLASGNYTAVLLNEGVRRSLILRVMK